MQRKLRAIFNRIGAVKETKTKEKKEHMGRNSS
jgi:hypothetical protein